MSVVMACISGIFTETSLFQDIGRLREEWRAVFFLLASTYFFGAVVYVTLVSGEKQSWADGCTRPAEREEYELSPLHRKGEESHTVSAANEPNVDCVTTESD